MKEIIAYIKPHKLYEVTKALQKVKGLRGLSTTEVKGFGRKKDREGHHVSDDLMDFAIYRRLEIFCDDSLADELVSIINKTACTGLRGDGKIYVLDVTKAYKIGKGEINS